MEGLFPSVSFLWLEFEDSSDICKPSYWLCFPKAVEGYNQIGEVRYRRALLASACLGPSWCFADRVVIINEIHTTNALQNLTQHWPLWCRRQKCLGIASTKKVRCSCVGFANAPSRFQCNLCSYSSATVSNCLSKINNNPERGQKFSWRGIGIVQIEAYQRLSVLQSSKQTEYIRNCGIHRTNKTPFKGSGAWCRRKFVMCVEV